MITHYKTRCITDSIAYFVVKLLRLPMDLFFKKRYGHRAVVLESVAAVPGMVGATLQHLKLLRRLKSDDGKWIQELLSEAENERWHLIIFMHYAKPNWFERLLVLCAQGFVYNLYFLLYLFSSKTAHRFVGYLEEEAVISYTHYLDEIDSGKIINSPAPQVAIDYYGLEANAKLRDVVLKVRDDEVQHRDHNHGYANDIKNKLR
jgi:ubiquinol oxidase